MCLSLLISKTGLIKFPKRFLRNLSFKRETPSKRCVEKKKDNQSKRPSWDCEGGLDGERNSPYARVQTFQPTPLTRPLRYRYHNSALHLRDPQKEETDGPLLTSSVKL